MMMKRKYSYNLDVFYRKDALSYYLLGVFMTDGNINVQKKRILPALYSSDFEWLSSIRDIICPNLKILKSKTSNCYTLQIYSTELGRWFIDNGCKPNKSLTIEFPQVPPKYLPDFIRGCIDGDGSVQFYQKLRYMPQRNKSYICTTCRVKFTTGSNAFATSFANAIYDSGFKARIETRLPTNNAQGFINGRLIHSKHNLYNVYVSGEQLAKFLFYVYYPNHSMSLPRKLQTANLIIDYYLN